MPLGVEPSQQEMVALPSAVDNWLKCQKGIHCAGHYMDDYYIIMPDVEQLKAVIREMVRRFEAMGIRVNKRENARSSPSQKPLPLVQGSIHADRDREDQGQRQPGRGKARPPKAEAVLSRVQGREAPLCGRGAVHELPERVL